MAGEREEEGTGRVCVRFWVMRVRMWVVARVVGEVDVSCSSSSL